LNLSYSANQNNLLEVYPARSLKPTAVKAMLTRREELLSVLKQIPSTQEVNTLQEFLGLTNKLPDSAKYPATLKPSFV